MALIDTRDLTRTFRRGDEVIRALDGVSVSIEEGEVCAITGPSGCGKSTLLYILGLLDMPSSGSYLLDGKEVGALNDSESADLRNKTIGFVFQHFYLIPRLNAIRNVSMPLIYSSERGRKLTSNQVTSMALEALKKVGLSDRIHHAPSELSGGQRQRVAIARAIVNRPSILLADEPTGNLDSKSGGEILELFEELNKSGVTVVIVTHDSSIANRAKRRIAMFDGKVIEG